MIFYAVLFIGFFLIAFTIRLNRFAFYALAENSVSLINVLLADVDDDVKVSQVQRSTNKLVISLAKMLIVLIIVLAVGSVPAIIYIFIANTQFQSLVFTSFY